MNYQPEEIISLEERIYLEKLFKPYGVRFVIMHRVKSRNQTHIRVRTHNEVEREFGEVRKFLSLPRNEQLRRIKEKFNVPP